jgi:hypothetical protein
MGGPIETVIQIHEVCEPMSGVTPLQEQLDRIEAMLTALMRDRCNARGYHVMDWQPINTAPKDVYVLACDVTHYPDLSWPSAEGPWIARLENGSWRIQLDGQLVHPTHWMPLPSRPPP